MLLTPVPWQTLLTPDFEPGPSLKTCLISCSRKPDLPSTPKTRLISNPGKPTCLSAFSTTNTACPRLYFCLPVICPVVCVFPPGFPDPLPPSPSDASLLLGDTHTQAPGLTLPTPFFPRYSINPQNVTHLWSSSVWFVTERSDQHGPSARHTQHGNPRP